MKTTTPAEKPSDLTMMAIMQRFSTEESARSYLESIRWPDGPFCPHCGNVDPSRVSKIEANAAKKVRAGLYCCLECHKQFTVTVGTIFEDSHIPLHKWLIAFYMMCASKTQISALQMQRHLELGSYRSAWFMCHRIRFAMQEESFDALLGGTVEADETYIGGKRRGRGRGYTGNKTAVVSLVERGGNVRSTVIARDRVSGEEMTALLKAHVQETAALNTDEAPLYKTPGQAFASHDTVNHHREEYSRRDKKTGRVATTNTVEGFFGNSKRSLDGTHHSISREHLPLYMAELDYKYNTRKVSDGERTVAGIAKIAGKRLTLRPMRGALRR